VESRGVGQAFPSALPDNNGKADYSQQPDQAIQFSLFFFSADGSDTTENKYQLFLEGVRFADRHGFSAVWVPERHFHPFGGLYPNPSVLGAAIATITRHIQIRAGSVVLPFQDPLRVAEEWSVIDNLSGGRAAIACASGWHVNDFVLAPDNYAERKRIMFERLEIIQKLWCGETISLPNGAGKLTEVGIFPRPLQPRLPVWLASHSDETFIKAGEIGANILTTVWNTNIENVARQIDLYRSALRRHGYPPEQGKVTLMLHTFIGDSMETAREKVKTAYEEYLCVNLGLQEDQAQGANQEIVLNQTDKEFIVSTATEQLFRTRGLIGDPAICLEKVKALQAIGVDEIACLIDFGVDFDSTMASLQRLAELKDMVTVQPAQN
jgi:natural product biosynthesis luciferase-like monooxygenase protein